MKQSSADIDHLKNAQAHLWMTEMLTTHWHCTALSLLGERRIQCGLAFNFVMPSIVSTLSTNQTFQRQVPLLSNTVPPTTAQCGHHTLNSPLV